MSLSGRSMFPAKERESDDGTIVLRKNGQFLGLIVSLRAWEQRSDEYSTSRASGHKKTKVYANQFFPPTQNIVPQQDRQGP